MFRIAIVEDEQEEYERLNGMIARYGEENDGSEFQTTWFSDGQSFLSKNTEEYNLLFLDIQMPGVNGMELAKEIRKRDRQVLIVFVTNMAQYAIEGYDVQAYDFILKPLNYCSFSMKFKRICNKLGHDVRDAQIMLVSGATKKRVKIAAITYIEVSGHNLFIHMTDGDFRMRGSISDMEKRLAAYHFVRCNVCYLVNLKHIDELRGDFVVVDGSELRISYSKKQAFLNEFAMYMGGNS